ncbi:MAG: site-2 protease family protein [Myxococcota bacterium]|nr:site-2 protease family protein [Myxococcota bacterium]
MDVDSIVVGIVWYGALLFSLTAHEAAHAWAALRGGDPTAYLGGQVSLDPSPHIQREPIGMVLAPIGFYVFGGMMFGWASTPFDPAWAERHPRRAAWMSLAGPAANAVIGLLAAVAIRVGMEMDVFVPPDSVNFSQVTAAPAGGVGGAVALLLSLLFSVNLLLVIFNLLPVPPLDGSGAVGLLLPESVNHSFQSLMRQPGFAIGGILLAWFMISRLFWPVFLFAINALYPEAHYG